VNLRKDHYHISLKQREFSRHRLRALVTGSLFVFRVPFQSLRTEKTTSSVVLSTTALPKTFFTPLFSKENVKRIHFDDNELINKPDE